LICTYVCTEMVVLFRVVENHGTGMVAIRVGVVPMGACRANGLSCDRNTIAAMNISYLR